MTTPPTPTRGHLLEALPDAARGEVTELLARSPGMRIERIVSRGQASPPGFWYDQPGDEWVAVVAGRAQIELAEPPETVELGRGDWLLLPAGRRHRVAWTDPERDTVWLAVHADPAPAGDG